jgi:hypothetical protein
MRARFMVARFPAMRIPAGAGRQLFGFAAFNVSEAAMFVGVGHWLHDTPPIFQSG